MLTVEEIIKKENILVLHWLGITSMDDGEISEVSGWWQVKERHFSERLQHNLEKKSKFLCCCTYDIGDNTPNIHLVNYAGLIIKKGEVTHAGIGDIGTSKFVTTPQNQVNSMEDLTKWEILKNDRISYNELKVINPEIFGIFYFREGFNSYTLSEVRSGALEKNLSFVTIQENNKEKIFLNGGKFLM